MSRLLGWAHAHESRYVTICNVHVVVSASQDAAYRDIINGSDMASPDGAPVVRKLRRQEFANQPRIGGPDVMWALCSVATDEKCGQDALGIKGGRIAKDGNGPIRVCNDWRWNMYSVTLQCEIPEERILTVKLPASIQPGTHEVMVIVDGAEARS
jgi:N-acetylglucosaminyldiphosphoundecaprenol N-acetyl-beta-D-mannosaminyltransferase